MEMTQVLPEHGSETGTIIDRCMYTQKGPAQCFPHKNYRFLYDDLMVIALNSNSSKGFWVGMKNQKRRNICDCTDWS